MPTMRRWALLALCGAAASGQLRTVAAWGSTDSSKLCDDMTMDDMVDEGISYYSIFINDDMGTGCNSITADGVHPLLSVPCDANPGDYGPSLLNDEWFPSVCDVCTASCEAAVPGICANTYGPNGFLYESCSKSKKMKANKGKKLSKKEVKKLCKKKKSKKACKKTKSGGKKVCKVKKGKCVPK